LWLVHLTESYIEKLCIYVHVDLICAYDLVLFIFVPNFYSVYVSSRLFFPITFSAVFQSMAYMITVLKFMNTISQWFPKYAPWIPRGPQPVPRVFLDAYL